MKLIKIPDIGWIVLKDNEVISNTLNTYKHLYDKNSINNMFSIVENIGNLPDMEKANEVLLTNHRNLIYYTGKQNDYNMDIVNECNLTILLSQNEFIKLMINSIPLFDKKDDEDMEHWNLDEWINFCGAELIDTYKYK